MAHVTGKQNDEFAAFDQVMQTAKSKNGDDEFAAFDAVISKKPDLKKKILLDKHTSKMRGRSKNVSFLIMISLILQQTSIEAQKPINNSKSLFFLRKKETQIHRNHKPAIFPSRPSHRRNLLQS